MARAIVFLVAARPFVLANHIVVVFIYCAASHDADLFVLAHDQAIEIEAASFFRHQRTVAD